MDNEIVHPKMTFDDKLRFTPYAWAKLLWIRDRSNTEVAGYGITGTDDPLLVTDFKLVKQKCTDCTFDLDPDDGAEFVEQMIDEGLMPWMFSNILIHTHPMNDPTPSLNDEENFRKAFSHPHWAIMLIAADGGDVYCRLKVNVGPGIIKEIKVVIDWKAPFCGSDIQKWEEEYKAKVIVQKFRMTGKERVADTHTDLFPSIEDEYEKWTEKKEALDVECNIITDNDLEDIDCCWDLDGNVEYWNEKDDRWYGYDPIGQNWYKNSEKIDTPRESWAARVMAWAIEYADERMDIVNG